MWLFISKRIRSWILFSIAVPVAAAIVRSMAEKARASDPASKKAKLLTRADSTLSRASRRTQSKRSR